MSVRVEMERKGQEEKDDGGGWTCMCIFMRAYVCRTDQKHENANEKRAVNLWTSRMLFDNGLAFLLVITTSKPVSTLS